MADIVPDGPITAPDGAITPDGPVIAPEYHSNIGRGFLGGVQALKGAGGGLAQLAGDELGLPSLAGWGQQVSQNARDRQAELSAPTDSLSGIHSLGDVGAYAAHTIGSFLPTLAGAIGSAAVGTAVAPGAGTLAGLGTFFTAQGTGDIYDKAKTEGSSNPGTRAILGGAAEGALNVLPVGRLLSAGGGVLRQIGEQAFLQGATGAATSEVNRAALGKPLTGSEALSDAVEAAVPAAGLGGVLGGIHARYALDTAKTSAAADVAAGEPLAIAAPAPIISGDMPYSTAPAAELAADTKRTQVDAARANEEARRQLVDAHAQITDELRAAGIPPAEAISFPDFVTQASAEAARNGQKLTQQQVLDMYNVHQREVMDTNIQAGQDLQASRTPPPLEGNITFPLEGPGGTAPEPTALALALDRATKNKQIDDAYQQRQAEVDANKGKDLSAIQNLTRASEEARQAEAGEATPGGVLPWKPSELSSQLDSMRATDQGMPPRLKQELAAAIKGKASQEAQLEALATLRDSKNPESSSFELLGKLHDKLSEGKPKNENPIEGNAPVLEEGQQPATVASVENSAPQGQGDAVPAKESQVGRPAGTTDERHSIAPPKDAGDLYPYHMTRDQAAKGPGGLFTEKAWWQDLAWAIDNPETKAGKEVLENGKFTDEQMAEAPAKALAYARQDETLRQFKDNIEATDVAAEKKTKSVTSKELKDIIDEWDPEDLNNVSDSVREGLVAADIPDVVTALKTGSLDDVLKSLRKDATPEQKVLIKALQDLDLGTRLGYLDDVISTKSAGIVTGRYSPMKDTVVIGQGGAVPDVILHELTHAATVTQLYRSLRDAESVDSGAKKLSDFSKEDQARILASKDLGSIIEDAKAEAERLGVNHYGLTNAAEFVAEAFSSPEFQKFLQGADKAPGGLWDRFLQFVKSLLGIQGPKSLLDRSLETGSNFFSNERFQGEVPEAMRVLNKVSEDFNSTEPQKSNGAVDNLLSSIAKVSSKVAENVPLSGIDLAAFKALLGWQTVGYVQQRVEVTPGLAKMVEPIRALQDAYNTHRAVSQHLEGQAAPYARSVELMLHGIKDADARRKMSFDMMTLAGEGSRLGVRLADDYATNVKRDPELKGMDKAYFEKLRRQYGALKQSNPEAVKALEEGEKINRDMHTQGMASRVAALIKAGTTADLKDRIGMLDLMSKKNIDLDKNLRSVFDDAKVLPEDSVLRGQLREMENIYKIQTENPYYHLGRNGDYFVRMAFKDMDEATYTKLQGALAGSNKVLGDVASLKDNGAFFRVESAEQAEGLYKKMVAAAGDKLEPSKMARGLLASADKLDNAAGLNNAMRSILSTLQDSVGNDPTLSPEQSIALKDSITRQFLSMLPETSSRKAQMQRTGVPGYEGDFLRNFSTRASGAVHDVTSTYTAQKFSEAFRGMRDAIQGEGGLNTQPDGDTNVRAQMIHDELSQRYINGMSPVKASAVDVINSLGHSFYLALSPAFLIRTSMQPFHRGLPILGSKYGFVKSGVEIAKATKAAVQIAANSVRQGFSEGGMRGVLDTKLELDNAGLSQKDQAFVQEMYDRGELNIGQSHQLARMAMGADPRTADLTRFASMTAQYAEITNRIVMGLAAYRMSGDMDYAIRTTRNAMDTFEPDQTARQIGKHGFAGKVTPLMTAFMNYNLQTMQQIARTVHDGMFNKDMSPEGIQRSKEAKKEFAGLMGTTMTLAGAMGLPFANVFAGLYNWANSDENHPSDVRADIRNYLADFMGKDAAEILAHGPSRALGVDLSTTGLQNILPGTEFLDNRRLLKDRIESQSQQLLGPALNAGIDISLAMSKMSDGYYAKGIEQALPSGLKAYYKAAQLATEGYTDSKGNPLPIEATPWDVLVQATGLAPAKKAERSEAAQVFSTNEELLQHRKQVLSDQVYKAMKSGDDEAKQNALAEMRQFNADNPLDAIRGIGAVFRQKAIIQQTGQASGTGVGVSSGRKMPKLEDIRFANTQGGMP